MPQWIEPAPVSVPDELAAWLAEQPFLAELLVRRGFTDRAKAEGFLNSDAYTPASPDEMPDMKPAVSRIRRAVSSRERICVWGDFDVDGQTATALLVEALRGLGADPLWFIPGRKLGHGVHIGPLADLIKRGVRLIITCDTGISAHEAVAYARPRGVDVIITDHHSLPNTLPDALAIVNPKRLPTDHTLYEIPGVGCAYKLVERLYDGQQTERFLDLAALGIVADVAVQTGDTRYLLQRGLKALRATHRPGLIKLMTLAGVDPLHLTEQDIGFALGPRLNALGRLGDASEAVTLLTSDDVVQVEVLAQRIEGLNSRRKLETKYVYEAALHMIKNDRLLLSHDALVLSHPKWPEGVLGIAAARLAERFDRPVVLISVSPDGIGRGSARSVAGCDITAALAEHAAMLRSYGGHTMAAGLSLEAERIPAFRQALGHTVRRLRGSAPAQTLLQLDAYVALDQLTQELVAQVELLAPFGPGNPPVTLAARNLRLLAYRRVGRAGEHLQLIVTDDTGSERQVMRWHEEDASDLPSGRFDLAYSIRTNRFGSESPGVLIEWIDTRETETKPIRLVAEPQINVAGDYRQAQPHTQAALLKDLRALEHDLLVWREAEDAVEGVSRAGLRAAPALAVWTAPPSPTEWQMILDKVMPARVYLFGADPGLDIPAVFLKRLSGLVKAAAKRELAIALCDLAAAMAHRQAAVRAGLRVLQAEGYISFTEDAAGTIALKVQAHVGSSELEDARRELMWLLQETAAYRRYWRGTSNILER